MLQGILIDRCTPEYSENMLPITAALNTNITINKTGSGNPTFSSAQKFDGSQSVEIYSPTAFDDIRTTNFDFVGEFSTVIQKSGIHIFSLKLFTESFHLAGIPLAFKLRVKLFVNTVNVETFEFDSLSIAETYAKWVTWSQSYSFLVTQVVDFKFELETQPTNFVPSPPLYLYIDALKFEIDNRNLGFPSVYSIPVTAATSSYKQKSSNYTILSGDKTIAVDTPCTITLPSAIGLIGNEYRVINVSSGNVIVDTTLSQTIGNKVTGNPTSIILNPEEWLDVISNNINWRII